MAETDIERTIEMERKAIALYPSSGWLLNRISIRNQVEGSASLELMDSYLTEKSPKAMLYNQAVVAIENAEYTLADSLSMIIDDKRITDEIDALLDMHIRADYQAALQRIAKPGDLNEVLLHLALREFSTAFELIKIYAQNPDHSNAYTWYIYATCAQVR